MKIPDDVYVYGYRVSLVAAVVSFLLDRIGPGVGFLILAATSFWLYLGNDG